ncbi:hypothetical protein PLICRDRAFT_55553 [Plicaturopsis crispa FD-325 SS-3]|nr:hypothetical protein PLICRDRAFT_55553 [Plicaturopsis crispa FD-325 SS-3]
MSEQTDPVSPPDGLKTWLQTHGGHFDSRVEFFPGPSGFSVVAKDALPPDTTVVSCPFSLAVTPEHARAALRGILGQVGAQDIDQWSERQLVCTYLVLHWIIESDPSVSPHLIHLPYLNTLPHPSKLRTPLHFTAAELGAFKGSNIYGATIDRQNEWKQEWQRCRDSIASANSRWGEDYTWEHYLTTATYLSSRAFPSTLLSSTPSLITTETSHPILLPGVDALNHARGTPVSWAVSHPDTNAASTPQVSLILHTPTAPGQELFNNYGAKPNAELILGYGFSLPSNPDDTIVLQVGGVGGSRTKREVGRGARGADAIWDEVLRLVAGDVDAAEITWEDELDAAGALGEMVQTSLDRLPAAPAPEMREEVRTMWEHYLEGQRAILESILEFSSAKEQAAIARAKEEGVDVVLEDE